VLTVETVLAVEAVEAVLVVDAVVDAVVPVVDPVVEVVAPSEAWAGAMLSAWIRGVVHNVAAPSNIPRFSNDRRVSSDSDMGLGSLHSWEPQHKSLFVVFQPLCARICRSSASRQTWPGNSGGYGGNASASSATRPATSSSTV